MSEGINNKRMIVEKEPCNPNGTAVGSLWRETGPLLISLASNITNSDVFSFPLNRNDAKYPSSSAEGMSE